MATISIEYSTDQSTWTAPSSGADWNYADGKGTDGDTIAGLLLSDTDTSGKYHENATGTEGLDPATITEMDFSIIPVWGRISNNTTYYFRLLIDDVEVELGEGESYPQVKLSIPAEGAIWDADGALTSTYSNACWATAGAEYSNSCWATAAGSYSNSCWVTAAATWATSCWLTAAGGFARDAALALSGQV